MTIGDKVRFLRSSGEGYIRKLNPDNTVDVEIEDGFIVPVLKTDVVVVAEEESKIFTSPVQTHEIPVKKEYKSNPVNSSIEGIFLALIPFNDEVHKTEIINLSGKDILFSVSEEINGLNQGLARKELTNGNSFQFGERKLSELKNWHPLLFQIIFFSSELTNLTLPLVKLINFNPASFFKNKKKHPISGNEVFLFNLKQSGKNVAFSTDDIFQSAESKTSEIRDFEKPNGIVDLHIEKLEKDPTKIRKEDILQIQLAAFEKNLENAIAHNMQEITFIHGTGNGVLRNYIHKKLSTNKAVEYFKDALKEKFGYGATFVKLK